MMGEDEDIFGQIDALLGKRSSAVLAEKTLQGDDFPMLTEVIQPDSNVRNTDVTSPHVVSNEDDCRLIDRRIMERRQSQNQDTSAMAGNIFNDSVCDALERKLSEMLRIQFVNLERSFRLIIQEELRRHGSD